MSTGWPTSSCILTEIGLRMRRVVGLDYVAPSDPSRPSVARTTDVINSSNHLSLGEHANSVPVPIDEEEPSVSPAVEHTPADKCTDSEDSPPSEISALVDLSSHPLYNHFLTSIRKHFLLLLKVKSLQALDPSSPHCRPLTIAEIDAYLRREQNCIRNTEDFFRFDFQLKRTHPFNLDAFDVFATSFLNSVNCGVYDDPAPLPSQFLQKRRIELAIYRHTKSAKSLWYRKFILPETAEDIDDRLSAAARSTRKRRLYAKRENAIRRSAPEHLALMSTAGAQGVSSDESSDELSEGTLGQVQDKTIRISPVWRSVAFQDWQHSVDGVVRYSSLPRVGTRQKPGTSARYRQPSTRVNLCAVAPCGLPRNCYDSAWLASLDSHAKERLQIQDEDYDLKPLECPSFQPSYRRARRVQRSHRH